MDSFWWPFVVYLAPSNNKSSRAQCIISYEFLIPPHVSAWNACHAQTANRSFDEQRIALTSRMTSGYLQLYRLSWTPFLSLFQWKFQFSVLCGYCKAERWYPFRFVRGNTVKQLPAQYECYKTPTPVFVISRSVRRGFSARALLQCYAAHHLDQVCFLVFLFLYFVSVSCKQWGPCQTFIVRLLCC